WKLILNIIFLIFHWKLILYIIINIFFIFQFRLPAADLERYLTAVTEDIRREALEQFCQRQLLPVTNRTITGDIRYCDKCCHVKPDRCHHCSVCGECVLKMDHHCPWVNNCVAFSNYKFFVLFLGYALIYCLFIASTTLEYFIKFWTDQLNTASGKFHILFVFFVSIMFAISLVSLFGYHIFLITRNRSTLGNYPFILHLSPLRYSLLYSLILH
ncbi:UNVERIFIED_CONTAM: hypothetical protein GTU68_014136, partial [Idotea baltica]|nr:hypothetical protein [Idotea baltica]